MLVSHFIKHRVFCQVRELVIYFVIFAFDSLFPCLCCALFYPYAVLCVVFLCECLLLYFSSIACMCDSPHYRHCFGYIGIERLCCLNPVVPYVRVSRINDNIHYMIRWNFDCFQMFHFEEVQLPQIGHGWPQNTRPKLTLNWKSIA